MAVKRVEIGSNLSLTLMFLACVVWAVLSPTSCLGCLNIGCSDDVMLPEDQALLVCIQTPECAKTMGAYWEKKAKYAR